MQRLGNLTRNVLWLLAASLCLVGCSAASSDIPAKGATDGGPIVLRVDDQTYTLDEIDAKAKNHGLKPYQDLYEHRRQAIDQIVAEILLEREAAARGISREDLVRQEVTDKASITDAEVTEFYAQNKAAMNLPAELDDNLRVQIRNYLGQQKSATARQELMASLRGQAKIEVSLEPPRVDLTVAAGEPARGPDNAPVTIVEYSDFQCPYCAKVGATLDRIVQTYPDKVRIVFRDFPLPMHSEAQPAAEAAKCAQEQGQFWPYHDKLFASQRELNAEKYKQFAEEIGLDAERFATCFDQGRYRQDVMLAMRGGQQYGVTGTPAFFVNGRFLSGAISFERFQAVIEEELSESGRHES